jgi:hypothetical protein
VHSKQRNENTKLDVDLLNDVKLEFGIVCDDYMFLGNYKVNENETQDVYTLETVTKYGKFKDLVLLVQVAQRLFANNFISIKGKFDSDGDDGFEKEPRKIEVAENTTYLLRNYANDKRVSYYKMLKHSITELEIFKQENDEKIAEFKETIEVLENGNDACPNGEISEDLKDTKEMYDALLVKKHKISTRLTDLVNEMIYLYPGKYVILRKEIDKTIKIEKAEKAAEKAAKKAANAARQETYDHVYRETYEAEMAKE